MKNGIEFKTFSRKNLIFPFGAKFNLRRKCCCKGKAAVANLPNVEGYSGAEKSWRKNEKKFFKKGASKNY